MRTRPLLPILVLCGLVVAIGLPTTAGATTADDDSVRVVVFSVDALDPDQLDAVDENGDPVAPNLQALRDSGTVWTEARAVMATETLPNHVAMGTGTYAGTNGIPGNNGRLEPGDDAGADPDLGVRGTRQATSTVAAIEAQCPDLRTVTAFSKDYVWRTFQDQDAGEFGSDPAEGEHVPESDSDFYQPDFNIPESGHAFDTFIYQFVAQQLQAEPVDHLFVNWGDHDRAGHVDASGADPLNASLRLTQRSALAQVDIFIGALQQQLIAQGQWDDTVLIVTSDHSMSWRTVDPDAEGFAAIDVDGALLTVDGNDDGSRLFTSLNGGAAFVYLTDPEDPEADRLLADARAAIVALDGVQAALYREPNPLEPGFDVQSVHPDWNTEGTTRSGELLLVAESPWAFGTFDQNPLPGNHGHAEMRHITAIVNGGWEGVLQDEIEPSDPDAVNVIDDTAALPEQVEQVDWAPTIGWLLGIEDPGIAAGGEPQWEGRVLAEAFERQPGTLVCSGVTTRPADDEDTDTDAAPADDPAGELAATGAGTALLAVLAVGAALAVRGRRQD